MTWGLTVKREGIFENALRVDVKIDAWYIYWYCLTQQDYRLFKLNRLSRLQNLKTNYEERFISENELNFDQYIWRDDIKLIALFEFNGYLVMKMQ